MMLKNDCNCMIRCDGNLLKFRLLKLQPTPRGQHSFLLQRGAAGPFQGELHGRTVLRDWSA